jgi:hypothetical protein
MVNVEDLSFHDHERGAAEHAKAYLVAAGLNLAYQYMNSGGDVAPMDIDSGGRPRLLEAPPERATTSKKMPMRRLVPAKRSRRGTTRVPRKKRKYRSKSRRTRARTYRSRKLALGSRPIKVGVRAKISKAQRYGCVRKIELGGLVSDPDCAYVGHSTQPGVELSKMWARAIVRGLLRQAGMDVTAWEQPIPFASATTDNTEMILKVFYRQSGSSVGSNDTEALPQISVTPLQTMRVISTSLFQQFANIVEADVDAIITRIELHTSDPAVAVAKFSAGSAKVHMRLHSKLVIQNRTRSSNSTQTGELVNDVTNNPLVGYRYGVKGNGFRIRNISASSAPDSNNQIGTGFIANNSTGLITARSVTTNISPSKKPLYGSDFSGRVTVNKIQILPGAIRTDTLVEQRTYTFNYMWSQFKDDIVEATTGNNQSRREYYYHGKSAMVGLEKLCNTRDAAEPNVVLGYELTKTYHMYVTGTTRKVCLPLVDIIGGTLFDQNEPNDPAPE